MNRAHNISSGLCVFALAGCASSVGPGHDAMADIANVVDVITAVDSSDVSSDASDIPRVNTCSELSLSSATASPGRVGIAFPGSQLTVHGVGLTMVLRVVVGGVEMPFQIVDDTRIDTSVPPMLAIGERNVAVETVRCMSSTTLVLSRLLAVVRAGDTHATLVDESDLSQQGTVDLGSSTVTQATFTFDGASLVTRDAAGIVRRSAIGVSDTTVISPVSTGPFALAQGTIQPTSALVLVPGRTPLGLDLLNSIDGTFTPYASPATDPISLALSLDGFRSLVLDRNGQLWRGDLPFARTPTWAPLPGWTVMPGATSVIMSQAPSTTVEHLAGTITETSPPTFLPINALNGMTGTLYTLPAGASHPRFLSGDVVVVDTITPEVIAFDITDLQAFRWSVPLDGETAAPGITTRTVFTLFKLGAFVLRPGADGIARAGALHVVDFDLEPPVETGVAMITDLRGAVGMQGTGNPFVAWTGHTLVRVLGDSPDPAHQSIVDLGTGGDVQLVVAQP